MNHSKPDAGTASRLQEVADQTGRLLRADGITVLQAYLAVGCCTAGCVDVHLRLYISGVGAVARLDTACPIDTALQLTPLEIALAIFRWVRATLFEWGTRIDSAPQK